MACEPPIALRIAQACERGDVENVRLLLDAAVECAPHVDKDGNPGSSTRTSGGPQPCDHPLSVRHKRGCTALFAACAAGHADVVSAIREHPLASPAAIDPERLWAPDHDGDTPFMAACRSGSTDLASMLMRLGGLACVAHNHTTGNNAIIAAVISQSVAMLELVAPLCPEYWRTDAGPAAQVHQPRPRWNPVGFAARGGSVSVMRWLMDRIIPTYMTIAGVPKQPPLCEACACGHAGIVALLLGVSGVDVSGAASSQQFTPLHMAVRGGSATVVRMLLADPRVNPNACDRFGERRPPFTMACAEGQLEAAQALAADPRVDVAAKATREGWSVFGVACEAGQADIIKWLATVDGVNVCERIENDWSGLHAAVQSGRTAAVEQLLQVLPPDACTWRDGDRWTPLHVAAYVGSVECVDVLLRHGANLDVNALGDAKTRKRGGGATPLHLACSQSHPDVVLRLLADERVDPSLCRLELVKLCQSSLEDRDFRALAALVGSGRIDMNVAQGSFTYLGTVLARLNSLNTACGILPGLSVVRDGVRRYVELLLADELVDPCAPRGPGVRYAKRDKTRVDERRQATRGRTTVWSSDEGIVYGCSSTSGSDGYVTVRDARAFLPSYLGRGKSARPWPRCLPPALQLALMREDFEDTGSMERLLACPSVQASAPAVLRRALKDHAVRTRYLRLRRARFPRPLLLESAARKQSAWLRRRALLLVRMLCHVGRASPLAGVKHLPAARFVHARQLRQRAVASRGGTSEAV